MNSLISKKNLVALAFMVVGSTAGLYATTNSNDPYNGQYDVLTIPEHKYGAWRQGELIVKLRTEDVSEPVRLKCSKGRVKANSSATNLNSLLSKYGVEEAEPLMPLSGAIVTPKAQRVKSINGKDMTDCDLSSLYVLRLDPAKITDIHAVAREFTDLSEVDYAEPNYLVYACSSGTAADYSTDPMYSQQWGIPFINLDKLWNAPVINSKRPVIAILDTGVDIDHPDLADNIWTNDLEDNGSDNIDDDGNGFADDVHGWDFVNQSARMRDNNGHGTHCAGIAAAVGGNGIGIAGANPDALIMPVTVLQSDGSGDIGTIIKGLDYAVANGANVISMSFGGTSNSQAEYDALAKAYQKAVLVAAAGNQGGDLNMCHIPYVYPPVFPGAYSFVLGVKASDTNGNIAGFSNWDCDGPFACGPYNDNELYSYDIMAPGTNIISTYPGGGYKALNGTSMACPLVAGAISRLYQCKDIPSKELLFGDLINTLNGGLFGTLDIEATYNISDSERKPTLALVNYRLDDSLGDGDLRVDAGETVDLYPTIRNLWGQAKNVKVKISLAENEDPDIVEFIIPEVPFGSELSSYSLAEIKNPLRFKISDKCVDGRHINIGLTITCDNISKDFYQEFILSVENGIELGGLIAKDLTLYPDKHYIVTSMLGVPEGVTLTLMPGTVLKFHDNTGLYVDGKVIAIGSPEKRIVFTKGDLEQGIIDNIHFSKGSELEYCTIQNLAFKGISGTWEGVILKKSIVKDCDYTGGTAYSKCLDSGLSTNNFYGIFPSPASIGDFLFSMRNSTNIKNLYISLTSDHVRIFTYDNGNLFGNKDYRSGQEISIGDLSTKVTNVELTPGTYLGSNNESILKETVWDINHPANGTLFTAFSRIDLSNRLSRPNYEAPGCVWKVVVDGYDAQDEFDQLPDLGVGRHKFEVYFSKPMNRKATPMIAMGVRAPYTQIAIAEDPEWRSETIDGDVLDVYTAYLTIKGSDSYDGLNRIYVADAEDLEYFPCPIEDFRFNVNVQSAGSMSAGFMAEAGVGKVSLSWDSPEENFYDMLGYNVYRYTLDDNYMPGDTLRINEKLLTKEEFVDYDIVPGTTYNYYYKVLRTSLEENSPSRVVSATPRAAGKGDANASGNVDVADVVTEVNYMVGRDPKPFIFDAADVNGDSEIDILDVVGTVNIIMTPTGQSGTTYLQNAATYTIEDGILYVESPVELAGIQAEFSGQRNATDIKVLPDLIGMENTSDWIDDESYRFLAFSLSGKTLDSGRHALLSIGNSEIDRLILVDPAGNNVMAIRGNASGIGSVMLQQMKAPTPNPFVDVINVPIIIGIPGIHAVELSLIDLSGSKMYSYETTLSFGEHTLTLKPTSLQSGFYMLVLSVDGNVMHTHKVIKK